LQRYGKMFHGQTLKCATSDYDQRHVIAFRPISAAARSWSYDKFECLTYKPASPVLCLMQLLLVLSLSVVICSL